MEEKQISSLGSEDLWYDFRKTEPIEKILKCWVCKEMLEVEYMELLTPATGKKEVVRLDFCPKCGRRLR